ncbi:Ti-type conjugative transfer relaxase TraA [Paraburkholderia strydomiana]|uniref:Ti-type conjugative transfer relaxase TraA n=1 Tax=Paraburkholderia strydomiana TaxID=1245417 RepID=UPI0038BD24B6
MATAFHVNLTAHSRSKGHSAVAGAAYRSGSELTDERTGEIHDYTRKQGIEHSEVVVPENAPDWARDRSALWNAAEAAENRKNSTIDREFKVSFPAQLSFEERRDMARQFSQELVERHGVAVDFSMHEPDKGGDDRNYHAHIMVSTRRIGESGFTEKARELDSFSTRAEHLNHYRERWAEISGNALEKAGYKEDAARWRSGHLTLGKQVEAAASRGDWEFVKENTDRVPQIHLGQNATQAERRGVETRLGDVNRENEASRQQALEERQALAGKLDRNPSLLVDRVTDRKAVFDHRDLARELHLHVDDPAKFQDIMARAQASENIVQLSPERFENGVRTPAKYSTQQMIDLEKGLVHRSEFMSERHTHGVSSVKVESVLASRPTMTDEQRELVRQVTSDQQFAAVVGDAGTGKSYSMGAVREIWEHSGYRVHGLALAGKAAEELQQSSGIESRTIASWELRIDKGIDKLTSKDVLVVDEAGMVGSKQLDRIVREADKAGAKVVWAGDHKQLEAINAGAGFRTVVERVNASELTKVQRQKEDWQKDASYQLARGDFRAGMEAYNANGNVHMAETREEARQMLVNRYMSERGQLNSDGKPATQAIMAHANKDVRALNEAVRGNLKEKGELGEGVGLKTAKGTREFADGDRFVFLKNDKNLGVKNGSTGTVERASGDHMSVKLDTGKTVVFDPKKYNNFDHGYALTIHKEQGASVDRAYPLATPGMDRSLSYVAMTRHKEEVDLYAAREDFRSYDQLAARMSRENRKESTLDYLDKGAVKSREGAAVEQSKPKEQESSNERLLRGRSERAELHKPDRELLAARREAGQAGLGLHQLSELRVARIDAEQGRIGARDEGVLSDSVRDSGQRHEGMHDARGRGELNAAEASPAEQDARRLSEIQQDSAELRDLQARAQQAGDIDADKRTLPELRELAQRDFGKTEADREYEQQLRERVQPEQMLEQMRASREAANVEREAVAKQPEQLDHLPTDAAVAESGEPQAIEPAAADETRTGRQAETSQEPAQASGPSKTGAGQQIEEEAAKPNALQQALAQQQEQRAAQQAESGQDAVSRALAQQQEQRAAQQPEHGQDAVSRALAQQQEQRAGEHAEGRQDAVSQALARQEAQRDAEPAERQPEATQEAVAQLHEQREPEPAENAAEAVAEQREPQATGQARAEESRQADEDAAEATEQPEQREPQATEQAEAEEGREAAENAAEAIEQREPQAAEQAAAEEGEQARENAAEAIEQPEQTEPQATAEQPEQAAENAAEQAGPQAAPEQGQQDALSRALAEQQAQRDAQQAGGQQDALAQALAKQQEQAAAQQTEGRQDAVAQALAQQEERAAQQAEGGRDATAEALAEQQAERDAEQAKGHEDAVEKALAEQQEERDAEQDAEQDDESGQESGDDAPEQDERDDDQEME